MKKTLFLTAILGAALCSTAMGAVTQWDISAWNNYDQASSSVTVGGSGVSGVPANIIDINFAPSTWNDLHGSFVVSVKGSSLNDIITLMALASDRTTANTCDSIEAMSLATNAGQTTLVTNTWTDNATANVDLNALKAYENLTFVLTRGNDGKMSTAIYDSSNFTQALATVTHNRAQSFTDWKFNGITIGGTEGADKSHAAGNNSAKTFTITKAGYSTSAVVTQQDLADYYAAAGPATVTWTGSQSNVWDANTENWTTSEEAVAFSAEDNVIFGAEATNKNVAVNSNISVTRVTANDDYTLTIANGKTIYSRILSVAGDKVLTINGGTLDTFSLSGDGKISGNGTVQLNRPGIGDVTINAQNFTGTFVFNEGNVSQHDTSIIADSGFAGTLEIRGRIRTDGTNFGNAQLIRFVGDRSSNNTGIWSNSAATISQAIEITGDNAVQFELSNSLTLSGALSGTGTLMITNSGGPLNITGGGSLGTLWIRGNTTSVANISGATLNLSNLYTGGRTTNIGTTVNAERLRLSENGSAGTVSVNEGGILNISGSNNDHGTNASVLLSHWGQNSTLKLNGGEFNAVNADVNLSWTGTGTFEAVSGTAKVKGIDGRAQSDGYKGTFKLGTETTGSAEVVLGSTGLTGMGGSVVLTLGNGTLGASADWSLSKGGAAAEVKANLIGTTETGTIINTTDANDKTTGHTITFTNGTKGAGNLTVKGAGMLVLNGDGSERTGKTTVESGTLKMGQANALGTGGVTVKADGVLDLNKKAIANELTLAGGTVTNTAGTMYANENGLANVVLTADSTIGGTNGVSMKASSGAASLNLGTNKLTVSNTTGLYMNQTTITGTGTFEVADGGNAVFYGSVTGNNALLSLVGEGTVEINADSAFAGLEGAGTIVKAADDNNSTLTLNVASGTTHTASTDIDAKGYVAISKTGKGEQVLTGDLTNLRDLSVSGGKLTVAGTATTQTMSSAVGALEVTGDLTVTNATQQNMMNLILGEDATVTIGSVDAHNNTLGLTYLTANGDGATIYANLDISQNTFVTLNGHAITLGCDLKLSDEYFGSVFKLTEADVLTLTGDEPADLDLFTSVESVTLKDTTYTTDFIMSTVDAGITISGAGAGLSDLFVKYSNGTVSLTTVPEPATATLSLLALAALAARRRRK